MWQILTKAGILANWSIIDDWKAHLRVFSSLKDVLYNKPKQLQNQ